MPATSLSETEARQVKVVWPRRENGRREASEEDHECRNGRKKTSWQTPNKMERRNLKRPGDHWPKDGLRRDGGPRPPREIESSQLQVHAS